MRTARAAFCTARVTRLLHYHEYEPYNEVPRRAHEIYLRGMPANVGIGCGDVDSGLGSALSICFPEPDQKALL